MVFTPMHTAVISSDINQLQILLEQGYDVDIRNEFGITPLQLAVEFSRNLSVIKFLLNNGANVNFKSGVCENTPLHLATKIDLGILELLIKSGADIHSKDAEQKTPLFYALTKSHNNDIVEFLIKLGADVMVRDSYGRTPLHTACMYASNIETVKLLMQCGADIKATDFLGRTPLHEACSSENSSDCPYPFDLIEVEESGNLHSSEKIKIFIELIKLLISNGADLYAKDDCGITPYLAACKLKNNNEIIKFLVQIKADMNVEYPTDSYFIDAESLFV